MTALAILAFVAFVPPCCVGRCFWSDGDRGFALFLWASPAATLALLIYVLGTHP